MDARGASMFWKYDSSAPEHIQKCANIRLREQLLYETKPLSFTSHSHLFHCLHRPRAAHTRAERHAASVCGDHVSARPICQRQVSRDNSAAASDRRGESATRGTARDAARVE